MKKLIDILNEVEEFKQPRDILAKNSLGKKVTSNPKTDRNFDVDTKKDRSRKADKDTMKSEEDYIMSNLNVREELTMEIVDLLNEISKERIQSYVDKAHDGLVAAKKQIKKTGVTKDLIKYAKKRQTGLPLAKKNAIKQGWMKEEVEELDEISTNRLIAYRKAATKSDHDAIDTYHSTKDPKVKNKASDIIGKRLAGSDMYHRAMKKKGMYEGLEVSKKYYKELDHPKSSNGSNNVLKRHNNSVDDANQRARRIVRNMKEDTELYELTKDRLKAYISKSKEDEEKAGNEKVKHLAALKSNKTASSQRQSHDDAYYDASIRQDKRKYGQALAKQKITKKM